MAAAVDTAKANGKAVSERDVGKEATEEKEEYITLVAALRRLLSDLFFPDASSSRSILRRVRSAVGDNAASVRLGSRNSFQELLGWTRRGGPLRALLVITVGLVALLAVTGLLVFMLFFVAATANAIAVSFLISLAAAGGFLAFFFACVTTIYIAALSIGVFVISAMAISTIVAVLITTGWIGFLCIVGLIAQKSYHLAKHTLSKTRSAVSSYSAARSTHQKYSKDAD